MQRNRKCCPLAAVFAATIAVFSGLGAPAAAFEPIIRLDIRPTDTQATFEVIEASGAGPTHLWCAAADHARRNLGAAASQRIYVAEPLGHSQTGVAQPKAQRSVMFSLIPPATGPDQAHAFSGVRLAYLTVRRAGSSLSLSQALHYCTDRA
jgi:hypothetical protein